MKKFLFVTAVILLPYVATSADLPPAKYIEKDACPFECCTYGVWNTIADTVAYAAPNKNAKVVGFLKASDIVEAITGEVHSSPVRFVVKKPHAKYKPGDVLWVYTYGGEGIFGVWRNGEMQYDELGFSPYGGSSGTRCENEEHCWGELEKELEFSWWVKLRSKEGWEGWSDQPDNFGNKDACG